MLGMRFFRVEGSEEAMTSYGSQGIYIGPERKKGSLELHPQRRKDCSDITRYPDLRRIDLQFARG